MLGPQIWSFCVKQLVQNHGDRPEKFDPSRRDFEGHSRSLEPTQTGRLSATSH